MATSAQSTPAATRRTYGHVTVLVGTDEGRYPDGNSLLIAGPEQGLLVDPSLTVHAAGPGGIEGVDAVVLSHVHEDHIPGLRQYTDRPVHVHREDRPALASMDGLLAAYGYEDIVAEWTNELLEDFHVSFRPDAIAYEDGACWDLGGGVRVTAVHLPGHTSGHCALLVEPDGFCYVADIELTGFGPFYGDATSDLERFEASLARCRELDARWYGTFHQKGVIEGRDTFLAELDRFAGVIERRERELLEFLAEPRTLDELATHRFLYRPHVQLPFVFVVERRSAELHVAKLRRLGQVVEVEPGRFRCAS